MMMLMIIMVMLMKRMMMMKMMMMMIVLLSSSHRDGLMPFVSFAHGPAVEGVQNKQQSALHLEFTLDDNPWKP